MPALAVLLLAAVTLEPIAVDEQVLDVRVVDVDADGREDVVGITAHHLLLLHGGKAPLRKVPVAPLTVVGRGLLGVVRDGRFHRVDDPFGEWKEREAGPVSLLAALGRGAPALLRSPGDLDGDGKDDVILCGPDGFHTPGGLVPVIPEAQLEIVRNEAFAVEYRIPAPVVGNWSGGGRELVFLHDDAVLSFAGTKRTDRVALPLAPGENPASIRKNEVHLRDIDGDGRLDLLFVAARGETKLFSKFDAVAQLFRGGRVYDRERKGFFRPISALKVSGLLLASDVLDLDGDGDLDLVLSTVDTSLTSTAASVATGSAPGTYYAFRFGEKGYERRPAWVLDAPIPLEAFTDRPEPPVRFLPDLDGDGRPEVLARGNRLRVFSADGGKAFALEAELDVADTGTPSIGTQRAAVPHAKGLVVVEPSK